MAQNTAGTYLGYAQIPTSSNPQLPPLIYTKVADITGYPDLFSAPDRVDVTTLSNTRRVYIKSIPDQADFTFDTLFSKAEYKAATQGDNAIADKKMYWAVIFNDKGEECMFVTKGQATVNVTGAGVNEARTGSVTIIPETELEFVDLGSVTISGNSITVTKNNS